MIKLIKDIIFAWKYKRAVRKAKKMSALFGMKYYVLNMGAGSRSFPSRIFATSCEPNVSVRGSRLRILKREHCM